jgi:opacity protein-like surface antigen
VVAGTKSLILSKEKLKMRKCVILACLALLMTGSAMAQNAPKAEIAGTYTYVRFNPGQGASGVNCHGGGGSVTGNLNNWFGVVGDFSGCKVTGVSGGSASAFTYLFGPKIAYRSNSAFTPYVQTLFGGARATSGSFSDNSFAMTLGGGVDVKVSEHVAIRLIQTEYLMTRLGSMTQNNVRIETGVVFRFGGK